MDDTNRLTITLLGQFGVWRGSQPVRGFRADPVRALLAYLAVYQGTPQRRETLAALLSPDRSDKDARTYLRKQIARLRKAFGSEDADRFLQIEYKSVMLLKGEALTVDYVQFSTRMEAVRQHRHRRIESCPACLARIGEAVALYQGELMQGLTFKSGLWEAWLLAERGKVGRQAQEALTTVTKWRAESGKWKESLVLAQRILELEAWHEGAHRWAMEAHWQLGDRNAALAQFERCQTVLWDELGVEPEGETQKLFKRMKAAWNGGGRWKDERRRGTSFIPHPSSLPSVATPFFGRKQLLTQLQDTLTNPANRLVTLLGEGGVGKSRLAIETGQRLLGGFPDGVWFVPLVAVDLADGQDAIVTAIAQALDFNFSGKTRPLDQLVNFLREAELLIILDQMEHVLDSAEIILTLLQRTRHLAILTTSRTVLNFLDEMVVPVGGLGDNAQLDENDPAIALFADRTKRVSGRETLHSELATIAEIVTVVDRNTLALELAAGWTRTLSLDKIAPHIQKSADFLATRNRSLPARHRSMRAVFETSWQLLDQSAQRLYGKLSIFRGGFTLEAAEAIVEASLWALDGLIEQSLLQRYGNRYVVHELLRVFSAEKQPLSTALHSRYAAYYTDHLIRFKPHLIGSEPQAAKQAIQQDEPNFWHAWPTAMRELDSKNVRDCIETLGFYFHMQGRVQEALNFLSRTLEQVVADDDVVRGELLTQQIRFLNLQGRHAEAVDSAEKATPFIYRSEDKEAIGRVLQLHSEALLQSARFNEAAQTAIAGLNIDPSPTTRLLLLRVLGVASRQGPQDYLLARTYLTDALKLSQAHGFRRAEAMIHSNLAETWFQTSQLERAHYHYKAAQEQFRQLDDPLGKIMTLLGLAMVAQQERAFDKALLAYREGFATAQKLGWDKHIDLFRYNLGFIYLELGRVDQATALLHQSLEFRERTGHLRGQVLCCFLLGQCQQRQHRLGGAADWYQHALKLSNQSQHALLSDYLFDGLGNIAIEQGEWGAAASYFQRAIQLRMKDEQTNVRGESQAGLLRLYLRQSKLEKLPTLVDKLCQLVEASPQLKGTITPLAIYLTLYYALVALGDQKRADSILVAAHTVLDQWASNIDDVNLRDAFMHNVPTHRHIVQLASTRQV